MPRALAQANGAIASLIYLQSMKTRLPKALLLAVLACTAAYGNEQVSTNPAIGSIVGRTDNLGPNIVHTVITTNEDVVAGDVKEIKDALTQGKIKGASPALAYSIVKDGEGTLRINDGAETVIQNVLVVREGTLEISNGSRIQNTINYTNHTSNLSVGGTNAKLVLDNGIYSQDIARGDNYCSAISLGTADGAAIVELKNNSVLHCDHYVNIGDVGGNYNLGGTAGPVGYITYTTTDGKTTGRYQDGDSKVTVQDVKGNEVSTTTYVKIDSNSEISAGTSLQISDAVIDIVGGGALRDGTKSGISNDSEWPESYFGYDGAEGVKTIINVYDGELDCNWNLETGNSTNGETRITVDGEKAVFSVAGVANFGGPNDKTSSDSLSYYDKAKSSQSNIILKNGGTGKFSKVIMGDFRDAKITVDATSSILAHENPFDDTEAGTIEIWEKGELENSGKIELDVELNGGVFTMEDGAVAAGLTATSGVINISGNVTFTGAVSLGGVVSESSVLMFSGANEPALTVYIEQGSVITMDTTSLTVDGQTFTVGEDTVFIVDLGDDLYSEDTQLFTLAGANAEMLASATEAIAAKTTVTWTEEGVDKSTASGDGEVKVSNIGTTVVAVPEPTTATLSLLALCGLAMRRRRK